MPSSPATSPGVGFDLYIRLVGEAVTAFKRAAGTAGVGEVEEPEEETLEVRVELPVDASIPHDYVPSERLRLDAYRKIAGATSEQDIAAVRAELVDRYGPLPTESENLLAVAAFRQICREVGVTEVALGPQGLRFSPLVLAESAQMRAARIYPGSKYRQLTNTLTLRPPTESDRLAADTLRDLELLAYCEQVLRNLVSAPRSD